MSHALLQTSPLPGSASLPSWFQVQQSEAALRYERLPQPTRTDESWRFSNLKAVDLQDFAPARPLAPEASLALWERSQGVYGSIASHLFSNDTWIPQPAPQANLPEGVLFLPLAQALQSHSELLQRYFMQEDPILGSHKFAALHRSSLRNGSFLYVPPGVKLEAPIQAFHWQSGSNQAVFPHTLLIAEENSAVTFIDWFSSDQEDARGLSCGVNDLWVGKNASLQYVSVQDWAPSAISLQSNTTQVAQGGSALHLGLHLGSRFARTESVSHLNGPGARSEMLALSVADHSQEFDQRTLQNHRAPSTSSDLLYKNALYDTARTIFSGLIRVAPEAHQTDAYQKVRNLVLSPDAEANSLPGLEILADQVRCSHGATTGEINPEELFYMQARGISKKDAYSLITFGFLNEILERFPQQTVRETLQACLRNRLRGH